jgi:hypothetical protein
MKLTDLEPRFLRWEKRWVEEEIVDGRVINPAGWRVYHPHAEAIQDAQGILFLCPACFAKNGGPVGTHAVLCWSRSRGVPDEATPGPGRWTIEGTGVHDLTLNGDPPGNARSVLLTGPGCQWHGFITNGEVTT